ncbi:MAG: TIGR01459 family HAD-type hydrolase [Betaproteobacteria bacterium]|nr:TIGR01459 family HAD-type hydrolase [Betaproteobacteria bacterium]MDE2424039.1 TIGR01459 family HAD-type hydrolase [Betaproteobacteria bacterium]
MSLLKTKEPQSAIQAIDSILELTDRYDVFLFDQWGVLHNGLQLYPKVNSLLSTLSTLGKTIIVLSNSGKSSSINQDRLRDMGLSSSLTTNLVTSGDVARWAFDSEHKKVTRFINQSLLWLDSSAGEVEAIYQHLSKSKENTSVVLAGIAEGITHQRYLDLLALMQQQNIPLLCINPDINRFTPQGILPSTGFYAKTYEEQGGVVSYIGKPDSLVYEYTLSHYQLKDPSRIVMVGDSIHHDVLGASNMGIDSILLRRGIHQSLFNRIPEEKLFSDWVKEGLALPTYVMDEIA